MFGPQNLINAISKQGQGHSFCAFDRQFGMSHTKPHTKFEVSSSSSFGDMFDRMPKIAGSRDLGHAHFQGKIICAPARHSRYKAAYQI